MTDGNADRRRPAGGSMLLLLLACVQSERSVPSETSATQLLVAAADTAEPVSCVSLQPDNLWCAPYLACCEGQPDALDCWYESEGTVYECNGSDCRAAALLMLCATCLFEAVDQYQCLGYGDTGDTGP